jgi:hypothetical protein
MEFMGNPLGDEIGIIWPEFFSALLAIIVIDWCLQEQRDCDCDGCTNSTPSEKSDLMRFYRLIAVRSAMIS